VLFQQRRVQSPEGSAGVSVALVLTLPALRGSMVLGNPSWLIPSLRQNKKIPGKIKRRVGGGTQRATPSRPLPPHTSPPKQSVNLGDRQPLRAPVPLRTSLPSVQQCLLPPAAAFPHPQRFAARAATETAELSAPSHLGAPALATECADTPPPGGHKRQVHDNGGGGITGIQVVHVKEI